MTPEELNRSMDFIAQSQARLAVAQEQDREWSKQLFTQMAADRLRMLELIEHHSRRSDEFGKFMQETREFHREALSRLDHALYRLDQILDKLSDRPN